MQSPDYSIEVCTDLADLGLAEWNDLLAQQTQPTPFMRAEFLQALFLSGSADARSGWQPCFLLLRQAGQLVAAAPVWEKRHSWGEYVFDWAWAQAYERHGLPYYPKLVVAVPFTPVRGTRLMARDEPSRRALLAALAALGKARQASGTHLLFGAPDDVDAATGAGWSRREGVQFHWQADPAQPWASWPEYLASLKREKRKKIQQEQRRVSAQGVQFELLEGSAIQDADWQFFHACYTRTYLAHGQQPYLHEAFFQAVGQALPAHWLMVVAVQNGERVAAALLAIDRALSLAWGRHWGALRPLPCVHFDACYYQPLQWCIANGIHRFEGGAQGEHKMARGLLPTPVASAHQVAHPAFAEAIARHVAHEGAGMAAYLDELGEHSPFKAAPPTD